MKPTQSWTESDRKSVRLQRSSEERTSISFTELSRQVSFRTPVLFKKANKPVNKLLVAVSLFYNIAVYCSFARESVQKCSRLSLFLGSLIKQIKRHFITNWTFLISQTSALIIA